MKIAEFINDDEQMKSTVIQTQSNVFRVLLTDMDSGRTLPHSSIHTHLQPAIDKAKQIVNVK